MHLSEQITETLYLRLRADGDISLVGPEALRLTHLSVTPKHGAPAVAPKAGEGTDPGAAGTPAVS